MLLSKEEMRRRHEGAVRIMQERDLEAIVLLGDRMPGDETAGDFHYFVNHYVLADKHCIMMFPNSEPVLLSGGWIQTDAARRYSWLDDCRPAKGIAALADNIPVVMKEKGFSKGRVGTVLTTVNYTIYAAITKAFPEIEFVDIHEDIFRLRLEHSEEENALIKKCANLCDGAYSHLLPFIKPGVTENMLRAELENYMIGQGAESCFTAIAAGRYSKDSSKNKLPLPYTPYADMNTVQNGDTVFLEITPQYDGYWSQMACYVSVGQPNDDLENVFKVGAEVTKAVLTQVKPGNQVKDLVIAAREAIEAMDTDYLLGSNVGHACGLDLGEFGMTADNEIVLVPGMALIIHPSILAPDGKCEIFCGDTYMVTEQGYEKLTHSDEILRTI